MPNQNPAEHKHHRLSLQPTSMTEHPSNLRHTQSHRYKTKKIIEEEEDGGKSPEVTIKEIKSEEQTSRSNSFSDLKRIKKKPSIKSNKEAFAFHNPAFERSEIGADRRSVASVHSSRQPSVQSSRQPSVIIREQYCCCAKRTRCERRLIIVVAVLTLIIIVLVIVVTLIATKDTISTRIANVFKK